MHRQFHRRKRHGYSLIETLMAGAITAVVLVPALSLTRQSLEIARDAEVSDLLTTLCVSKLEEQLSLAAATLTNATVTGNFAADGYANVRFSVVRTDAPASGGISGRLMVVTATVWSDDNNNGSMNTGELQVSLMTKVAKMALYQQAAGGS